MWAFWFALNLQLDITSAVKRANKNVQVQSNANETTLCSMQLDIL